MSKTLVIVESPAKGKTIEKYLGSEYQVQASFGHIRDLPAKNMGVDIDGGFIPVYEISPDKTKRVAELRKMAKTASRIILATDPDREGEAIAWHLAHVLHLDPASADRVTYHEITKSAIQKAFSETKKIDLALVDAQQSRRILDRIVGYEVSPVLWKKVKTGLSAGRVQSVAVKLLVEREREIRAFVPEESWKIEAMLVGEVELTVEFVRLDGKPVKFTHADAVKSWLLTHHIDPQTMQKSKDKKGNTVVSFVHREPYRLDSVEKKEGKRTPGAPFTTSTLQQEVARKLGYSVKQTMDIAQRLYQSGHITYMRTDSVNLSDLALSTAHDYIVSTYGSEYAVKGGRKYKTKQASAQEAHEAIRPTDITKTSEMLGLDGVEGRVYRLIRERTLASQMADARIELTTYRFIPEGMSEEWIAKGEVVIFPGFMQLYVEGTDDEQDEEDGNKRLPLLSQGALLQSERITGHQKFSLPPPRYTEASLVKKLESEGIGRPSTYAPTIQTIQDRGYVILESKKLLPTDIAFVVTDYLEKEFPNFMEYGFTAEVEEQFDRIARGELPWQKMLGDFYTPFHHAIENALETEGRFASERILGKDDVSGRTVLVRMSRYGPVAQIGTSEELDAEEKPRYANLAPGQSLDTVTLEEALALFTLPKSLGEYEEKEMVIGIGRFGPYIKWGDGYVSIPRAEDPHIIDRDRAIGLIEQKKIEDAPLGTYDGEPYTKGKGRFGPFLKWKNLYVNIPRSIDPETISSEEAEKLISAKREKEANRYIHQWSEEKISVENGRYGPFIKWGKSNLYLKRDGKKITDIAEIQSLTCDDVKAMIQEQVPGAFEVKKKASTKKKTTAKKTLPKKTSKK